MIKTFSKWIAENDKTPNVYINNDVVLTIRQSWSRALVSRRLLRSLSSGWRRETTWAKLRSVCFRRNHKLLCDPRYNLAVVGSTILRTFPFKEHDASDMRRMLTRSAQTMNVIAYFVHTLGEAAWRRGQAGYKNDGLVCAVQAQTYITWWLLLVFQPVLMSARFLLCYASSTLALLQIYRKHCTEWALQLSRCQLVVEYFCKLLIICDNILLAIHCTIWSLFLSLSLLFPDLVSTSPSPCLSTHLYCHQQQSQ